jgi:hypothetical protein
MLTYPVDSRELLQGHEPRNRKKPFTCFDYTIIMFISIVNISKQGNSHPAPLFCDAALQLKGTTMATDAIITFNNRLWQLNSLYGLNDLFSYSCSDV